MLYTKPVYQPETPSEVFDLVDDIILGTLITPMGDKTQISHPVFMADRARNRLVSHIARNNDHTAAIEAGSVSTAIIMDQGSYLSSSWYPAAPTRDSAPTWSYRVAHFHGRIELLSQAETAKHLFDLVKHMERHRPDGWKIGELGPGGLERRLPNIVGYELVIDSLEICFRLGQEERSRDMAAAGDALRAEGKTVLADRIAKAKITHPGE